MVIGGYAVRVALAACVGFCLFRTAQAQYCGARAVARILQDLEMPPADLAALIKELNGADGSSRPSFPTLAQALRRRGVTALFVRLDALAALDSKRPAILHVNGDHFAVYEGRGGSKHFVWWGPGPQRAMSWVEIERIASQPALLVGREPPNEMRETIAAECRRSRPIHHWRQVLFALGGVGVCLAGWLCVLVPRKPRASADRTTTFL